MNTFHISALGIQKIPLEKNDNVQFTTISFTHLRIENYSIQIMRDNYRTSNYKVRLCVIEYNGQLHGMFIKIEGVIN